MIRTYSELRRLETIDERFSYLSLKGQVGRETFGFDRYLNQDFYKSSEWRHARTQVIARDMGCDLGVDGYEIFDRVYIHHMNPIAVRDIVEFNDDIVNPEYLIVVTHTTHNAIHYGQDNLPRRTPIERRPGDTKLW
jgi:hypothetical protein